MTFWVFVKLLHIFAGVFWMGAAVITIFFVLPAVRAAGPAGGAVMKQLTNERKLPLAINVAAAATTFCGILLYWRLTGGFTPVFSSALAWMGLMVGSLSGILAFLWGFFIQSRNAKRLGTLTAGIQGPPTPEQAAAIAKLQQRLHLGGIVGIVLLVISLGGMVMSHPM